MWLGGGGSTEIAQYIFVKQLFRKIFLNMDEANFFQSQFISAKFSSSNARLSFAAMWVQHQNHAIDIRRALKSYDFSEHVRGEILLFRNYLGKIQLL